MWSKISDVLSTAWLLACIMIAAGVGIIVKYDVYAEGGWGILLIVAGAVYLPFTMYWSFKKYYSIIIFAFALVSCETNVPAKLTNESIKGTNAIVYELDSCEYIVIERYKETWGSHKGNCKYCAQRNKTK